MEIFTLRLLKISVYGLSIPAPGLLQPLPAEALEEMAD
jgi:hypothetical protein